MNQMRYLAVPIQLPRRAYCAAPPSGGRVPAFHPDHIALELCGLRVVSGGLVLRVQFKGYHTGQSYSYTTSPSS